MKRRRSAVAVLGIAAVVVAACSSATADVTAAELRAVVETDAVAFDEHDPGAVADRLAAHRVILLGETHHLREHWEFVATLMAELYDDGFRQVLIEAPHMASWLIDDYVQGSQRMPNWTVPPFYDRRLTMIRDVNRSLAGDPIHVRGIDANEAWYGGAADFHLLLGWFADTLPPYALLDRFLDEPYPDAEPDQQRAALDELLASLEADRSELAGEWGDDDYDQLVELLRIELVSIDIREVRAQDDDDGARAREDLIKQLTDEQLDRCDCGTVINIGGHHAQKSHLMGTDQEWLGDYLAHTSTATQGSLIVVGVSAAEIVLEPGADGTPWAVVDSESPDNELRRLIAETLPGQTAFLPLEDPLFAERTVAFNSEDVVYVTPLGRQFDAVIQYGTTHRMPVN